MNSELMLFANRVLMKVKLLAIFLGDVS